MENRVKDLRLQRQLTQEELARLVGVSRQTIISIENGRYNPSLMLAYRIAKIFSMSIEEVFDFAAPEATDLAGSGNAIFSL
ncbi:MULTISPECIES: helix-turn-helix transcriptional regulator [Neomoorella]|uniref:Anaerobic benzoate catabolism transcriptional regulator n=1 Tax=Neomoorella thermoacetica TaxID=1525 RepID=A0A1J5JDP9_NEOTH|nr:MULTISPECIES: helix-turn-helix transcriptional regulator [Moorella]OIQ07650.1 anaerobic benzoate catabolism transcriptional regulator [Moorella thermoacetica]OIQ10414.1 anaerobic benzoate catabolism transcriptional regulator [Moorella thermoacetica]BCV22530.1 transcriptional regulator [Moorella sp. Hama-1]